jgi:hypothetical protein
MALSDSLTAQEEKLSIYQKAPEKAVHLLKCYSKHREHLSTEVIKKMDYFTKQAEETLNLFKLGQLVGWWIRSEENPLWNCEGTSALHPEGGPPQELVLKIEEMQAELGSAPDDLSWGYEKCKK